MSFQKTGHEMSWNRVQLVHFLKVREDRFKPNDKAIYSLKRVDKIDFSGQLYLSNSPSKTDMILVKNGDLLISGINVYKGAVAVYEGEEDITATIHYSSYEYDKTKIDVEFLKLFLKSPEFLDAIKEQVPGGIKTEIKPKHLLPLEVTMPDLAGQKKIVKCFSEVAATNDTLTVEMTHQIDLVKQLRQSFLREAMQGKLVEQDPKDEPASELLEKIKTVLRQAQGDKKRKKQKELPSIMEDEIPFEIPGNWVWCRLGEITKVKIGSTPSRQRPIFWNGDINWVSSGEVANNYIFETKEKITQSALENTSLIVYPIGTVLVAMIGQGKTRGQTSILKIPAATNQNVAGLIIEHEFVVSEYLWFFFLSRYETTRGGASGGNQPALNGIKISNTLFPLPPLPEQHRIVAKLEQLMQLCDVLEQSIRQSKEQAKMLLQSALREALQPKAKVIKLPVLQKVEEKAFLKRKVLATYIINQSLNDPHFGDTKFEKLLHLADYIAIKRNLNQKYIQKVAGPYDNKFTYPYFEQVEGSKWFIRKKNGPQYIFKPGQNHSKSLNTYGLFSEDELKRVDRIIRYFKNSTYERPEIASTLYAVWNNRVIRQHEINDDLLIEDFYKWDESKKRYERSTLVRALQWMRQEGLVPDGWGKVIQKTAGKK